MYSEWNEYSDCSASCGDGTKTKERICIDGICSRATHQDLIETSHCNERSCKFYIKISNSLKNGIKNLLIIRSAINNLE